MPFALTTSSPCSTDHTTSILSQQLKISRRLTLPTSSAVPQAAFNPPPRHRTSVVDSPWRMHTWICSFLRWPFWDDMNLTSHCLWLPSDYRKRDTSATCQAKYRNHIQNIFFDIWIFSTWIEMDSTSREGCEQPTIGIPRFFKCLSFHLADVHGFSGFVGR